MVNPILDVLAALGVPVFLGIVLLGAGGLLLMFVMSRMILPSIMSGTAVFVYLAMSTPKNTIGLTVAWVLVILALIGSAWVLGNRYI